MAAAWTWCCSARNAACSCGAVKSSWDPVLPYMDGPAIHCELGFTLSPKVGTSCEARYEAPVNEGVATPTTANTWYWSTRARACVGDLGRRVPAPGQHAGQHTEGGERAKAPPGARRRQEATPCGTDGGWDVGSSTDPTIAPRTPIVPSPRPVPPGARGPARRVPPGARQPARRAIAQRRGMPAGRPIRWISPETAARPSPRRPPSPHRRRWPGCTRGRRGACRPRRAWR